MKTPKTNFAKQSLNSELKNNIFDFYKQCGNNVKIYVESNPIELQDLLSNNFSVLSKSDRDLRKKSEKYVRDNILSKHAELSGMEKFLVHHSGKNEYNNSDVWIIPYDNDELDLAHAIHKMLENNAERVNSKSFNIYHIVGDVLADTKTVNITIT